MNGALIVVFAAIIVLAASMILLAATLIADATISEHIIRTDYLGEGSLSVHDSVDKIHGLHTDNISVYTVRGDNTLVENQKLSSLVSQSQNFDDLSSAPHLAGMKVMMGKHMSSFYVQDAEINRIIDNGTEIEIFGIAHTENPIVFCHGMPIATLGMKDGQKIAPGMEFSEVVSIPLSHQAHLPELMKTTETPNPYFVEKTFRVLQPQQQDYP